MALSRSQLHSHSRHSGGYPSSPRWLSDPDKTLPLKQERVQRLRTYLRKAGAGGAQAQVLYGQEIDSHYIKWHSEPFHPDEPEPEVIDEGAGFVVRKISAGPQSPWKVHSIVVQSPYIMRILRKALADYPGISPQLEKLTLHSPFHSMFHRWNEFVEAIERSNDYTKDLITGFVAILKTELDPYFHVLKDANDHCVIEHENLWIMFPPGELVWWDLKRNHCVGRVIETRYNKRDGEFDIFYEQRVWNGTALESKKKIISIPGFTGMRPIPELNAVPLTRKPDSLEIRELLLERGKKFLRLAGCHHKQYLGLGKSKRTIHSPPHSPPQWEAVSGRVILDAALWHGKVADRQTKCRSRSDGGDESDGDDESLLICSPLMKGYSLSTKKWYKLFVANISEITWGGTFTQLVMGETQKKLLLGFAKTKLNQATSFDDFVAGKGKGVIILLSGPPGVGKTLTVESIADEMKRPLYALSAGELGTSPGEVESRLRQALTFCKEWDGIMLLDEADIFLERRSVSDLQRNELVSIFLRLLEYYDGMMFLTTNRSDSIDPAFQSRIDMKIEYGDLTNDSRKKIWANLIQRSTKDSLPMNTNYDELATHPLNGRQIKNAVKLAVMLAAEEEKPLEGDHLLRIINML